MICKTCQIAGDLVAEARSINETETVWIPISGAAVDGMREVSTKEAVRSVAHLFHGICKGNTHCDCQHKVDFEGKALQQK